MTFLSWGCEPLAAECRSCIDALCKACRDEFRIRPGDCPEDGDSDSACRDAPEPDCDRCDPERIPDCARCQIIFDVCTSCSDREACESRITG